MQASLSGPGMGAVRRAACAVALLLVAAPMPALAEGPNASMPLFFQWPYADLHVLVVPPAHGPLVTALGVPLDLGPTYLDATLDAMVDWDRGIDAYVAEQPTKAWLQSIRWQVWIAPDLPPRLDIVITFEETLAAWGGMAWEVNPGGQRCVILATEWFVYSLTYADMYNVIVHEFGHCLGLEHAEGVAHDALSAPYAHVPGATTELHCPSNLDALGLTMSFGAALGKPFGSKVSVTDYHTYALRPACEAA